MASSSLTSRRAPRGARGLKHVPAGAGLVALTAVRGRSPSRGAWIENGHDYADLVSIARKVARWRGAWIETIFLALMPCLPWLSRSPSRGAWIETQPIPGADAFADWLVV